MSIKKKSPDACECGRLRANAEQRHYHSRDRVYTFWRCQCGREWTTEVLSYDERDPVSADEVVDVHRFLATHDSYFPE